MTNESRDIDPVAIVKNYELRNMSATVGMLAGSLQMFRAFRLNEPEWAAGGLQSMLRLQPLEHPAAVIEQAYSAYGRFLQVCSRKNCRIRTVGWDYNIGI
jgi:hypothetical protein